MTLKMSDIYKLYKVMYTNYTKHDIKMSDIYIYI